MSGTELVMAGVALLAVLVVGRWLLRLLSRLRWLLAAAVVAVLVAHHYGITIF